MTRSVRVLVGLLLCWIVASVLVPAGRAAASRPCLPSGGCATVRYTGEHTGSRGGRMHLGWQLYLTGTDIAGGVLYLYSPPGLSLSAASVTLNGAPAPSGAAQPYAGGLAVVLGSLLPLTRAPGFITVGYTADVAATANPELHMDAQLDYRDAGQTNSAHAIAFATLMVAFPDMATSTTGTDTYLPRGQDVSVFYGITSSGQVDPPGVSLEIRTSPGFTLTSTPRQAFYCHPIGVRRTYCSLPFQQPVAAGQLGIRAEPSTRAGQTGTLVLISEPVGSTPDRHQADNIHRMRLHVRGTADLTERWRVPAGGAIPLGRPVTITAEITNNGPDPATGLTGWILVPENSGSSSTGIRVTPRHGTILNRRLWLQIPKLAPHATYSVSLRVTGLKLGARGTLEIRFIYPTFPASPGLIEPIVSYDPAAAEGPTSVTLTVVPPIVPAGGRSLPATGTALASPAAITGAAMLFTGLILLLLARRRRAR